MASILVAATYPLAVTQAARLMQANRNLSGPALASALGEQTWDGSVKSLVGFPSILRMMNEKIDWTQELGDAYLVQEADVMETVQALRQKAKGPADQDGSTGREVVADPRPSQGPPYSAPVVVRQSEPGPRASTPVVIAYSNIGTAASAVERVWATTGGDRPRQSWGRPVSYVPQGPPGPAPLHGAVTYARSPMAEALRVRGPEASVQSLVFTAGQCSVR